MGLPIIRDVALVDVQCGEDVIVVQPANLYGCQLGDRVFVGPFVEIQRNVSVGSGTRVQSHAFICEGVSIGRDCFISHGAKFVNDLFKQGGPARGNKNLWQTTQIGDRVSIGTNATILPISICDDVVIGAGAVVTRDIVEAGIYAGVPARKVRNKP